MELSNWNPSTAADAATFCQWRGVTCNNMSHVETLDVSAKNLSEILVSPSIFHLPFVKTLNLSSNRLSGEIPEDIFSSTFSLRSLNISNNNFTGQIPNGFIPGLEVLDLEMGTGCDFGSTPQKKNLSTTTSRKPRWVIIYIPTSSAFSTFINITPANCQIWQRLGRESGISLCIDPEGLAMAVSSTGPPRKATGSDRKTMHFTDPKRIVGYRKTLVFYTGKAPKGGRTDWVMNEYRLSDTNFLTEDIVLCKIYRKATSLKVLQRRAEEHAARESNILPSYVTPLLSLQDLDYGAEAENLESRKEPYMEAESAWIEYFTRYEPK
ncbi:hypothetical protein GQ457_05G011950 [Hibiscus cannabinus]